MKLREAEHGTFEHGKAPFSQINASTMGFVHPPTIDPLDFAGLSTHEDVLPTILDMLQVDPPDDLTGHIVGSVVREYAHALVYKKEDTWQAVISPTDKLLYHWTGDKYYFDSVLDPAEMENRYQPTSPRVLELWDVLLPKVDAFADYVDDAVPDMPGP